MGVKMEFARVKLPTVRIAYFDFASARASTTFTWRCVPEGPLVLSSQHRSV